MERDNAPRHIVQKDILTLERIYTWLQMDVVFVKHVNAVVTRDEIPNGSQDNLTPKRKKTFHSRSWLHDRRGRPYRSGRSGCCLGGERRKTQSFLSCRTKTPRRQRQGYLRCPCRTRRQKGTILLNGQERRPRYKLRSVIQDCICGDQRLIA